VTDSGRPVVIRNVTLIDGTGAAPVPGQALIAEGRRISWIGPDGSLPRAPVARSTAAAAILRLSTAMFTWPTTGPRTCSARRPGTR
jgi:hypothetical protein